MATLDIHKSHTQKEAEEIGTLFGKLQPILNKLREVGLYFNTNHNGHYLIRGYEYIIELSLKSTNQYHSLIKNYKKKLKQHIQTKHKSIITQSAKNVNDLVPPIARGSYGSIHQSKENSDYVIKLMYSTGPINIERMLSNITDITISYHLNQLPNTIHALYGNIIDPLSGVLILPRYSGSLRDFLNFPNVGNYVNVYKNILYQILLGLQSLHDSYIYHCDLKAENVLLKYVDDNKFDVVVADFGLSIFMIGDIYDINDVTITDYIYSLGNLSPPVVSHIPSKRKKYISKCDIWAYGLLLLDFVTSGWEVRYISEGLDPAKHFHTATRDIRLNLISKHYRKLDKLIYKIWNYRNSKSDPLNYRIMDKFFEDNKPKIINILDQCFEPDQSMRPDVYGLINCNLFDPIRLTPVKPPTIIDKLFKLDKYYNITYYNIPDRLDMVGYIDSNSGTMIPQLLSFIEQNILESYFIIHKIYNTTMDTKILNLFGIYSNKNICNQYVIRKFQEIGKLYKNPEDVLMEFIQLIRNTLNYDIYFSTGYHCISYIFSTFYKKQYMDINIIHILYIMLDTYYDQPLNMYTFYKTILIFNTILNMNMFLGTSNRSNTDLNVLDNLHNINDNRYYEYVFNIINMEDVSNLLQEYLFSTTISLDEYNVFMVKLTNCFKTYYNNRQLI